MLYDESNIDFQYHSRIECAAPRLSRRKSPQIKIPLQTSANLLDAIQAKLNLCHYRLPQRFLFLHWFRSSYNCLLGLPQQGCKCFRLFGLSQVGDCGDPSFLVDWLRI
jgi:hypothetical protein